MFKQKKFPTGNKNAYAENRHMFTQGIIFIEKIPNQKFCIPAKENFEITF